MSSASNGGKSVFDFLLKSAAALDVEMFSVQVHLFFQIFELEEVMRLRFIHETYFDLGV